MAKQPPRRPNQPSQAAIRRPASAAPVRKTPTRNRFDWLMRRDEPFIFDRRNFIVMGIGLLLVVVGLAAMSGGAMPNPEVWDPNLIYSPRRITLAPMLMVAGFVVVAIGIFLKPNSGNSKTADASPSA